MVKTIISAEDVEILRLNKNVESVSKTAIQLTRAFKKHFYEEKQRGIPVKKILQDAGIAPEILGESRISNLCYRVNKMAKRAQGFSYCRANNKRQEASLEGKSVTEQLSIVEHQLAYVKMEVEFLKKLRLADMEAQKQWALKQHRK